MADNRGWRERRRGESSKDVSARWRAYDRKNGGESEYHQAHVGASVNIDITEYNKLLAGMRLFDLKRRDFIMTAALNRGGKMLNTRVKNLLADRTGIRVKGRITRGFRPVIATPAVWSAGLTIEDRYTRITPEYYGAKWTRSMPGVRHNAWNAPQTARGSFLAAPHGQKLAFKRIDMSDNRSKLHVLFGPNMAREVERNAPAVDHIATAIANWFVVPEAKRLIEVEWARIAPGYWKRQ